MLMIYDQPFRVVVGITQKAKRPTRFRGNRPVRLPVEDTVLLEIETVSTVKYLEVSDPLVPPGHPTEFCKRGSRPFKNKDYQLENGQAPGKNSRGFFLLFASS